ncbi:hypothetical protein Pla22_13660 [Rubripirellula amarantea]|uniref:Uncharacterized protein n=1 Tax=Rubripirellula amarantea TaxID=2527999 RepID=A0A5C5WS47_9BACT|nr:hypothetical protein Pla22_13660 [Rubripirellula amarantea]
MFNQLGKVSLDAQELVLLNHPLRSGECFTGHHFKALNPLILR